MKIRLLFIIGYITIMFGCSKGHNPASIKGPASIDTATYNATQFENPLLANGISPYVLKINGSYYFLDEKDTHISLYQATSMSYIMYAYGKTIYTPPINTVNSDNVVSPKIYFINGKWYVYYSADDGYDAHHRMFVLENSSANPMNGSWVSQPIAGAANVWAKDEVVLTYNGQNYMIWSGWATADSSNTGHQQLYISKMTNPLTLDTTRVMISQPTNLWEQYTYQQITGTDTTTINDAIDEAPAVLINPAGNVYLTFSANTCAVDNYCIGMMGLTSGGDPMNPSDWQKNPNPVFSTTPANSEYGPGHNSFFKSIDGKQDWIIYDANSVTGEGCTEYRNPRMQMVNWNTDGSPNLGTPAPIGVLIAKPSGEGTKNI